MARMRITTASGRLDPSTKDPNDPKSKGRVTLATATQSEDGVKFLGRLVDADNHIVPPFVKGVNGSQCVWMPKRQVISVNPDGTVNEINPAAMLFEKLEQARTTGHDVELVFTASGLEMDEPVTGQDGRVWQTLTVNPDRSLPRSVRLVERTGWSFE